MKLSTHLLPLCFYPTRIVLVDDNHDYLAMLCEALSLEKFMAKCFTDPKKAINFINSEPNKNPFESALAIENDENTYLGQKSNLSVDIQKLITPLFNRDRFNDLSLAIIDYSMPNLNGDQLASLVSHHYLKKIMLTGQADHKKAIELLNYKIIDSFAEKSLDGLTPELLSQIKDLQLLYFSELISPISTHCLKDDSVVFSKAYQSLLSTTLKAKDIVEYYTTDMNGTKLLLDRTGKQYWLVIATDEDFAGWIETAELADANDSVLTELKTKNKLLFLFTEDEQKLSPSEWADKLYATTKLDHNNVTYYYALIEDDKISKDKYVSYSEAQEM